MKLFIISSLLCFLPVSSHAFDAMEVAAAIQQKYEQTQTFTAQFKQITTIAGMAGRERRGEGTLVVKKPAKLRWDYTAPERQVLICDGDEVTLYVASQQQMIVSNAAQYLQEDLTYAFFIGKGNISSDFMIEPVAAEFAQPDHYGLRLTPKKPHGQVHHLLLWVDTLYQITHIRIVDHLDSVTDIRLAQIQLNNAISDTTFLFVPPKGTEIILQ